MDLLPPSPSHILANAPLAWIALAATGGVVADRYCSVPTPFALALASAALVAWFLVRSKRQSAIFPLLAIASLGAVHHHNWQHGNAADSIRRIATVDGVPVSVRGRLAAPVLAILGIDDPLYTLPRTDASKLVVDLTTLVQAGATEPIRGRIVAYVAGQVERVYPGDEIELHGRIHLPHGPGNPGEFNVARDLRDQGIDAILSVPATPDAVRLIASRWPNSVTGWLGRLHAACKATLKDRLTAEPALAAALLLGDGSGLTRPEWDKFLKSGVVHALAISGQHLIVLAGFLMLIRRATFARLTPATIGIAAILFCYALLTGGRPPAMRAAWMILAFSAAVLLRRPASPSNAFALAWILVLVFNPADVFQTGCQLSFLAVALLQWFVMPWLEQPTPTDPLADLTTDDRATRDRWWHAPGKIVYKAYLANGLIWLAVTPLIAERFNIVSPIALIIGPPVVLATSIALVAGFLLLATAPLVGTLSAPFAWATDASLFACETMIDWGLAFPAASFTLGDLPPVWPIVFYLALFAPLVWSRARNRWFVLALSAILILAALSAGGAFRRPEFHIAFLSVGHGGCTVIETSGGRVLVYDAGAITGPDLTRRIILPYLSSRGIRHIDDLFISHADLDHYSGVPDLLDRISIRRVSLTPSFNERATPAVRRVMAELKSRAVPTRIVKSGHHELIDDVTLDVLHPPAFGPDGKENARSLVMLVRKDAYSLLLTGDLEDAGLEQVLNLRPPGIDILMAPHHGSRLANPTKLVQWASPKIAISSQGRPRGNAATAGVYEAAGVRYLTTFREGAIQIGIRDGEWEVSLFRSKETFRLGPARVR